MALLRHGHNGRPDGLPRLGEDADPVNLTLATHYRAECPAFTHPGHSVVTSARDGTFDTYRHTGLLEHQVDQAIMQLYRRGVINVTRIADVLEAYETPPHDWGDKTAWRLFNATTYSLTGRVAENPSATGRLHQMIDGFCEPVDTNQLLLPSPS